MRDFKIMIYIYIYTDIVHVWTFWYLYAGKTMYLKLLRNVENHTDQNSNNIYIYIYTILIYIISREIDLIIQTVKRVQRFFNNNNI